VIGGTRRPRQGALIKDMPIAARTQLPTGTWHVDPVHSRIEFAAKYLGIATVRGVFKEFEGRLDLDEGRAYGTVNTASLDTNYDQRDEHLRSPDFFEVVEHPALRFESTEIRPRRLGEDTFEIEGDLTIRGVTNPIVLRAELHGSETDPWGNELIALEVTGELDRSDWGMTFNQVLGSGNLLVSDRVKLQLDIAAVKQV
jgi:polyisoprenoid-binding protein YceI